MAYRTYMEDEQIFGNNEYYPKWIEFLKTEGIEVDEDGCYNGYIRNVDGMFAVIAEIVRDIDKSIIDRGYSSIFDLSQYKDESDPYKLYEVMRNGYVMTAANAFRITWTAHKIMPDFTEGKKYKLRG